MGKCLTCGLHPDWEPCPEKIRRFREASLKMLQETPVETAIELIERVEKEREVLLRRQVNEARAKQERLRLQAEEQRAKLEELNLRHKNIVQQLQLHITHLI